MERSRVYPSALLCLHLRTRSASSDSVRALASAKAISAAASQLSSQALSVCGARKLQRQLLELSLPWAGSGQNKNSRSMVPCATFPWARGNPIRTNWNCLDPLRCGCCTAALERSILSPALLFGQFDGNYVQIFFVSILLRPHSVVVHSTETFLRNPPPTWKHETSKCTVINYCRGSWFFITNN